MAKRRYSWPAAWAWDHHHHHHHSTLECKQWGKFWWNEQERDWIGSSTLESFPVSTVTFKWLIGPLKERTCKSEDSGPNPSHALYNRQIQSTWHHGVSSRDVLLRLSRISGALGRRNSLERAFFTTSSALLVKILSRRGKQTQQERESGFSGKISGYLFWNQTWTTLMSSPVSCDNCSRTCRAGFGLAL